MQPAGATSDSSLPHVADYQIANLAQQEVTVGAQIEFIDEATAATQSGGMRRVAINDNVGWTPAGAWVSSAGAIDGRVAVSLELARPSPETRFLIAFPFVGQSLSPAYELPALGSGADEVESVPLDSLNEEWTIGIVARQPHSASLGSVGAAPLASVSGPTGDSVVWSLEYWGTQTLLSVEVYDAGELEVRRFYYSDLVRGESFESTVSTSPSGAEISISITGSGVREWTVESFSGLELDSFQWAGADGDVEVAVDPVLLVVDDERWSDADRSAWIRSSLTEKATFGAKPAPGDFNFDGVVDDGDYTVWADSIPDPAPGQVGDVNSDGYVNGFDAAIWQSEFGSVGAGLDGDINSDGVVNVLDYIAWRDAAPAKRRTGGPAPTRTAAASSRRPISTSGRRRTGPFTRR